MFGGWFLCWQLAELLGFTKLDLIQDLLTHRQAIVSSMLENSDRLLSSSDMQGRGRRGGEREKEGEGGMR